MQRWVKTWPAQRGEEPICLSEGNRSRRLRWRCETGGSDWSLLEQHVVSLRPVTYICVRFSLRRTARRWNIGIPTRCRTTFPHTDSAAKTCPPGRWCFSSSLHIRRATTISAACWNWPSSTGSSKVPSRRSVERRHLCLNVIEETVWRRFTRGSKICFLLASFISRKILPGIVNIWLF